MTQHEPELMTIGAFSRIVGVTPSALRYYDDCGLLVPAHTDSATGYRHYSAEQRRRAVLIRILREAELPLTDVRRVVDEVPEHARRLIGDHLARRAEQARATAAALRSALRMVADPGERHTGIHVVGSELSSGLRQVLPATDRSGAHEALAAIRVEIAPGEVRLVATDRYRLALRVLHGWGFAGEPAQISVATVSLPDLLPALLPIDDVTLRVAGGELYCSFGDREHTLAAACGSFPDYRQMLDHMARPDARLVVDRMALLATLRPAQRGDTIRIGPVGGHTIVVSGSSTAARSLTASWTGAQFDTVFDACRVADALAASVGPDVIVDLAERPLPAAVRSADHGSFTTLVMPRRPQPAGTVAKDE